MKPLQDTDLEALNKAVDPASDPNSDQKKIEDAFKALVTDLNKTGSEERLWQLAEVQRCHLLWHGEPGLYWDKDARSWQSIWDAHEAGLVEDEDVDDYNRDINFYRPLLESLIAAASVEIPRIHFVPAKASDPLDILTSREATKVSTYLDIINDARARLHDAYFILSNQHFAAGYVYYDEDGKKYGYDSVPQEGMVTKTRQVDVCPNCLGDMTGAAPAPMPIDPSMIPMGGLPSGPGMPPPMDPAQGLPVCPNCNTPDLPMQQDEEYQDQDVIGYSQVPRNKICIEIYGPQNVRIPFWVKDLKSTPYLELDIESPTAYLADLYTDKADDIMATSNGDNVRYDRWVRDPIVARGFGSNRKDRSTHRRIWVRDWALNMIPDKDLRKMIRTQYPDGACLIFVDELFIKALPSKIDEHWDLTETSFSDTIHDDPGGKIIIPSCEIQNDMVQLWVENIKHNIPQTFVDARMFDEKQFGKTMARPGLMTPVKPVPGSTIAAGVFETRPTTISQESGELYRIAQEVGQFTSGALPSIFGGYIQDGSKTAFEYDASQKAALQRVALKLGTVNSWWARLKFKAVEMYKANAKKRQEFSAKSGDGYKAVVIDPDNLQGLIEHALPEDSAMFPTSWTQKRDFVVQSLRSNNPNLIQLLFHPENSTFLKEVIGIPELYIPGELDRMKQLWEIAELLQSAPIELPQMGPDGQATMVAHSSLPPNPNTDNGVAHILTLQSWINSEDGREAQKNNPQGFDNVLAHLTEHMQLMPPPGSAAPGGPGGEPPPDDTTVMPPPQEGQ